MHVLQQLDTWLSQQLRVEDIRHFSLHPLKGDASFRRYYRVKLKNITYIAVYSPKETEDNAGFINMARLFSTHGIPVPHIHAYDAHLDFFLISDFGDTLLYHALPHSSNQKTDYLPYYHQALSTLAKIQQSHASLLAFDINFMQKECENFTHWFLQQHLSLKSEKTEKIMAPVIQQLLSSAAEQPQCLIHRDYHSRNLMILRDDEIGVIDFQDAMIGPITYDLVSLLRDCYFTLPTDVVEALALDYHQRHLKKIIPDKNLFLRYFDFMGIQRHLKAIFIFARKYHRDGVKNYLTDIPRTLQYIIHVSKKYPELRPFREFMLECLENNGFLT